MNRSLLVAVVSSAGGLEAVSELLAALPAVCGEAFVIVQHLDPARRAVSLDEALAERTNLRVVIAHDGVVPERGHVYVSRPNATVTIVGGHIRLSPRAGDLYGPGNTLFTSIAEDLDASAIGVVLSGRGADGALGIRAIKQAGGTTFAQYPGSARFPSMPISAIETGCVDFVLRPNEIARELGRLSRLNTYPESIRRRVPLISVSVTG